MQHQSLNYSVMCPQCRSLSELGELKPDVPCCGALPSAQVCHVILLEKKESGELFSALRDELKYQESKSTHASEAFFGAIIGSVGLDQSKIETNSFKVNGKIYRINDMNGKTRKTSFKPLNKIPLARKVVTSADTLLRRRVREEESSEFRLQCNVNAYSIDQQLTWHRDEPVRDRKATAHTFLPGSATLFVLNPEYPLEGGSFIYRRMRPPVSKVLVYKKVDDPGKNYPECLESPPVPQGVLTGIFGEVYTHGIHRNDKLIDIPPGRAPKNEIMRISLNFRFLRKSAYLACKGDPRDW